MDEVVFDSTVFTVSSRIFVSLRYLATLVDGLFRVKEMRPFRARLLRARRVAQLQPLAFDTD
jgi:hypothetical protein